VKWIPCQSWQLVNIPVTHCKDFATVRSQAQKDCYIIQRINLSVSMG
jgi:hypothetical protein